MAAIYCADIFCDDCIEDIKCRIATELWAGSKWKGSKGEFTPDGAVEICEFDTRDELWDYMDRMDERDYDSGDYPKYCSDDAESDSPAHCGSHDDCFNAGELSDGTKYGYCFGNDLTTDGEDYVREAVREGEEGGVAREVWAVEYNYLDFEENTNDDD